MARELRGLYDKMVLLDQLKYYGRCLRWLMSPSLRCCPVCESRKGATIARKGGFITLRACEDCRLLYRVPQEPASHSEDFYQEEYQSSLATQILPDEKLTALLESGFKGSEKDFTDRIEILKALGLGEGSKVLDFGSSWGYGVWQLRAAGFDAVGMELSRPRAGYGKDKLGVDICDSLDKVEEGSLEAIFSSHVLEHIPSVGGALDSLMEKLKSGGYLLAFVPNGSLECQQRNWQRFHCNWGRLHPIYINDEFIKKKFDGWSYFLASKRYEDTCDIIKVSEWGGDGVRVGDMGENEMVMIIRKAG